MGFPTDNTGLGQARPFCKLALDDEGVVVAQASPPTFERRTLSTGADSLLVCVPRDRPDLFRRLSEGMRPPVYLLYILHTPRSEAQAGRYQSPLLDRETLDGFLRRFEDYLAGDARHDVWVYSPEDETTLVWDRHNQIYVEGPRVDDFELALVAMGFAEGVVPPIGVHIHYYREQFDADAEEVLDFCDWRLTPLRPEDEQ